MCSAEGAAARNGDVELPPMPEADSSVSEAAEQQKGQVGSEPAVCVAGAFSNERE